MKTTFLVAVIAIASVQVSFATPPPIGQRNARERVKQKDFARTKGSIIELGRQSHASFLKQERESLPAINIAHKVLDVAPQLGQDIFDMATIDAIAREVVPLPVMEFAFSNPDGHALAKTTPETATLEDLLAASLMRNKVEYCDHLMAAGAGRGDPNWIDVNGHSLLYHAVQAGQPFVVEHLLQLGADPVAVTWWSGHPVLKFALEEHADAMENDFDELARGVDRDCMAIIDLLIAHGADVNYRGPDLPLLHQAVWHNAPDIVQRLVTAGADLDMTDKSGRSAIQLARDRLANASISRYTIEEKTRLQKIVEILETPREAADQRAE